MRHWFILVYYQKSQGKKVEGKKCRVKKSMGTKSET